jgi:hypothetical protein
LVVEPVVHPANLLQTDYKKVRRQKLKKTILICLTMVLVLMVGSLAIAGGNGKTACLVDPPTGLECSVDFIAETVFCSWGVLSGANKYAFEIVFEIPLLADPTATQEVHFDAGTTDTNITVTFAELQAVLDPFDAALLGQLATAKVKGLNPPQKGACSQANAFAEIMIDFTPPPPIE